MRYRTPKPDHLVHAYMSIKGVLVSVRGSRVERCSQRMHPHADHKGVLSLFEGFRTPEAHTRGCVENFIMSLHLGESLKDEEGSSQWSRLSL